MNLVEIQEFKKVGRRLRQTREACGLSLTKVSGACGIGVKELSRIEDGELMGFKQAPESTLINAQIYSDALDLQLGGLQQSQNTCIKKIPVIDEVYIPAFLRRK